MADSSAWHEDRIYVARQGGRGRRARLKCPRRDIKVVIVSGGGRSALLITRDGRMCFCPV
jgi:hypothetical protein